MHLCPAGRLTLSLLLCCCVFGGCGDDRDDVVIDAPDAETDLGTSTSDTGAVPDGVGVDPSGDASSAVVVGRCDYQNAFSTAPECKDYTGTGWDRDTASSDCAAVAFGTDGVFVPDGRCGFDDELGRCEVPGELGYVLVLSGSDSSQCAMSQTACETFIGGLWAPDERCEESIVDEPAPMAGVFVPPTLVCREPLEGEPAGAGTDGEVCTWNLISACTEPGRRFADYASCDVVVTQRPYYAYPVDYNTPDDDPRLDDEAYMAEMAWLTEQTEACACMCCHSSEDAPSGSSGWYVEAGPLWLDTVDDDALAMLAGLVDSTAFGAFDPQDNNGFDRSTTGIPTTDVERMQTFLVEEYLRRGNTIEDAERYPAFGGPLYTQLFYEPEPCTGSRGLQSDGTIDWGNSGARYVYVLEGDSDNPGVPPNLDLPDGTLWRIDVDASAESMTGPIAYGEVPDGANQTWPQGQAPPALAAGETYYVYVLLDVGVPILRCLSTL